MINSDITIIYNTFVFVMFDVTVISKVKLYYQSEYTKKC